MRGFRGGGVFFDCSLFSFPSLGNFKKKKTRYEQVRVLPLVQRTILYAAQACILHGSLADA